VAVSGVSDILSNSSSFGNATLASPDPTPDILKMPFLAPLLATAGRAVASQGLKGAAKTGMGKLGQMASKEGLKTMATEGAKQMAEKVTSKEGMEQAMGKLKERQQAKEMERRQKSNELMEQGRQSASTGTTTMGA
tara:strand:+ start:620 stop:1027 length:408 start_codon:yes stop_codon:yes gene_type:complete